ncbi:MAG: FAD-dependent oxidoreductase, partial [Endomicrobia bacterium]|nr:FAD-dependent oxidoreductase [Endomicrobiia bacterium]
MKKILIVGGVAGGASAAARLRRLDETAQIIMFERGEYISFANCALPYYIGGVIKNKSVLTLQTPESFKARFNVDVRIQNEVTSIDRQKKSVTVTNLKTGEKYLESYDDLILSPGAEPVKPNIPGINSSKVFTLRNISDTYKIKDFIDNSHPKTAVVVGGGFIGVEVAENLVNAGLSVTLAEMSDQVLAVLDYDMACEIHTHIKQKGVNLLLGTAVQKIEEDENGLNVVLSSGNVRADILIMSVGVRPESALAKNAGISVSDRGAIIVDEYMKTSDKNIYAVGDAVEVKNFVTGQKGMFHLAGPANKQGRIAADNICGVLSKYEGTQGSAIIQVFDMTAAVTGIDEKKAKKLGIAYDKTFTYSANHASYYPGAVNMCIKTLFEKVSGKILGAQITGFEGVDKRCDVIAVAIRAGMTAFDLTKLELCYAPPYSSAKDPVNMAGFAIENVLTGKLKSFHWHDVSALPRDGSVILLDARMPIEYENGHIDGFINIPIDELRNRIPELDKNKKIYLMCQSGLRGYVAARMLSQSGFDVSNLIGGYRLYSSIFGKKTSHHETTVKPVAVNSAQNLAQKDNNNMKVNKIDASGLQCPGPILALSAAVKDAQNGDVIEITTTDPAFVSDVEGYCRRTGNVFLGSEGNKGVNVTRIKKSADGIQNATAASAANGKNFIVFSGDLDKAIASFIMANASAALGRNVSMFFTFWGLNLLRKSGKVKVKKDFISKMFGFMMPKGSQKLGLSKMNMGGMGAKMIRYVMKKKNVN